MSTEVQQQVPAPEVVKMNLLEADLCLLALNAKDPRGVGIKDLRVIQNVVDCFESKMPLDKRLEAPKYTQDVAKNKTMHEEYEKAVAEWNTTEIEVTLNQFQKGFVKSKMSVFTYPGDAGLRKYILSIAEKLEV